MRSARVVVRKRRQNDLTPDPMLQSLRSKRMRELRAWGLLHAEPVPDADPAEVLKEILSTSLGYMRWARDLVGEMKPEDFWMVNTITKQKIPGPEFELEMRLLGQVRTIAETLVRLRLDEKGQAIEEAKIELLSTALREAARQIGLPESTQRELGSALRSQLALVEATEAS